MADILGTRELSEITGLSEKQIRELARDGLPSHRVGGCLAFDAKEALDWLDDAGMLEDGEVDAETEDEEQGEETDETENSEDAA